MLHFENEYAKLDLAIVCYEISDTFRASSDDANWLTIRATFQEDELLLKDSNSCLLTYELQAMTAGLKVLGAGLKDSYDSDFSQPYFLLRAWKNQDSDTFSMDVSFTLPNTMDENDVAELSVQLTAQQLQQMIAQLDIYCAKFPER